MAQPPDVGILRLHQLTLQVALLVDAMKKLASNGVMPPFIAATTPLYTKKDKHADILVMMPAFDRWGLCPVRLVGNRPNPLHPAPSPQEESEGKGEEAEEGEEEEEDNTATKMEDPLDECKASMRARHKLNPLEVSSDEETEDAPLRDADPQESAMVLARARKVSWGEASSVGGGVARSGQGGSSAASPLARLSTSKRKAWVLT
jgi:hypothetical protein